MALGLPRISLKVPVNRCGGNAREVKITFGADLYKEERLAKYNQWAVRFALWKRVSVTNSLQSCFPDIARELHPRRNGKLTADMIIAGSSQWVWWHCDKGPDHNWREKVAPRTSAKQGCPFCANKRVSRTNCLKTRYPAIAKQLHPTKNGTLKSTEIIAGSHRPVWWICSKGADHVWQETPLRRTQGIGCPFCAGRRVSVTNSLGTHSPHLEKEWHEKKNGKLTPNDFTYGSNELVWWRCLQDNSHEWRQAPHVRAAGHGCPYCTSTKVSRSNSLAALYPPVANEWHKEKNGTLTPDQITAKSTKYAWWQCSKMPGHNWRAQIGSRTQSGSGCPLCSGASVAPENSLAHLYPEVASQWHKTKNGRLSAKDVTGRSAKRVWWQCHTNSQHAWQTAIYHRTVNRSGCPLCYRSDRSKTK